MKQDKSLIIRFLTPALVIFTLIFVYPLIRTVVMSLFYVDNITASFGSWKFVGFENFGKLLSTPLFLTSLKNLFKIWSIGGVFVLTVSLIFAAILNSGIKGKKFFRNAIYMPYTISAVAIASMWLQYVYNTKYGLLTTLFTNLGWERLAAIAWTDPDHKFAAMMIAYCFGMVGYHMVIFSSGIEKIPQEYHQAALIDGADKKQDFFHITLPLLRGVLKTNLTMWSISSVGFFVWSQMFTSQGTENSTVTPVVYLYQMIFGSVNSITERNAGLGCAVGVVTGILIIILFTVINLVIKDDDFEL